MLLSICIPCFKRIKQLEYTLQSIYLHNSDVPLSDYEVVISDNDPDREVEELCKRLGYENLRYFYSECEGFMNSYYVLTYAEGDFLKLHNSQSIFRKGSLSQIIDDIKAAKNSKALLYYSNGMLNKNKIVEYNTFESFMFGLSYWSSSSNGFCIWRDQFNRIKDINLNHLFPHTSLFLTQYNLSSYIINDEYLFDVQRISKRGGHNKFEAFTVEYPSLIDASYKEGHISKECRQFILNNILYDFLPTLLFNKYIARIECFDIEGYRQNIRVYFPWYSYYITFILMFFVPFRKLYNRILRLLHSKSI